jgi:hypothetical protein
MMRMNSWSLRLLRDSVVNLKKMTFALIIKKILTSSSLLLIEVARLWCSITGPEAVLPWEGGIGTRISRESSVRTATEGLSLMGEATVGVALIPSKTSKRSNLLKIAMKIAAKITKSLVVVGCRDIEGAEVECSLVGWGVLETAIDPTHLKGAGDKGSTIIKTMVLQEVGEVDSHMSQAAEIVILVVLSKSNVLTTKSTHAINKSTTPLILPKKRPKK